MSKKRNEIRQNLATREWVIYAPGRMKRPKDYSESGEKEGVPEHDPECPFCPDNEYKLPEIRYQSGQNSDWQTRVVPNKFPALEEMYSTERFHKGIYFGMEGFGVHEVLIETPLHNRFPALMSYEEMRSVMATYHRRYCELLEDKRLMMCIIFKNHGKRAGTSLEHPHSQIIALGIVPRHIRLLENEAQRHFDNYNKCVFCQIMEFERTMRTRVIYENDSFVAYVPYAAEVPFQITLMPIRHRADFGNTDPKERDDLALALVNVLGRLRSKLGDPDYNYVLHSAPRFKEGEPHLHWHMEIRPRITTKAGFELGAGISINPSLPEDDADLLNQIGENND